MSSKRRKVSLTKEKAKAKAATKKMQDKDDEEEDFNAFSSKQSKPSLRPPNGSLEKCAHCGKKFPIVSAFYGYHHLRLY